MEEEPREVNSDIQEILSNVANPPSVLRREPEDETDVDDEDGMQIPAPSGNQQLVRRAPEEVKTQTLDEQFQQMFEQLVYGNIANWDTPLVQQQGTTRRIGNISRISSVIHTLPPNTPTTADDLKNLWQAFVNLPNKKDFFPNIMMTIIRFLLDHSTQVKNLFMGILRNKHSREAVYYAEGLLKAKDNAFILPYLAGYKNVPQNLHKALNLVRITRAKKLLVEAVTETLDSLCFHRTVVTGFSLNSPCGKEVQVDEMRWEDDFEEAFDGVPYDPDICENEVTLDGKVLLMNAFEVSPTTNTSAVHSDHLHSTFSSTKIETLRRQDRTLPIHAIPLTRSLCEIYNNENEPLLHGMTKRGSCRMMKNTSHKLVGRNFNEVASGLDFRSFTKTVAPTKAFFTTHLKVACVYEGFADDEANALAQGALKEQVIFEILKRDSSVARVVGTDAIKRIPRVNVDPFIAKSELNPGFHVSKSPSDAAPFLKSYFDNDYYLVFDPTVVLANLHVKDQITFKLMMTAIEGQKNFVTALLIASTVKTSSELSFKEALKSAIVIARKNADFKTILENITTEEERERFELPI